jgi:hypothetical protein
MRFEAAGQYTAGVADVDPIANPGRVTPEHTLLLLRRQQDCDITGRRILLMLEAPVAETLTLGLWTLDDATDPTVPADAPDVTTRRWYRFATGIVVTGSQLTEITAAVPAGGKVFARREADALVGTRTLKASCVA